MSDASCRSPLHKKCAQRRAGWFNELPCCYLYPIIQTSPCLDVFHRIDFLALLNCPQILLSRTKTLKIGYVQNLYLSNAFLSKPGFVNEKDYECWGFRRSKGGFRIDGWIKECGLMLSHRAVKNSTGCVEHEWKATWMFLLSASDFSRICMISCSTLFSPRLWVLKFCKVSG